MSGENYKQSKQNEHRERERGKKQHDQKAGGGEVGGRLGGAGGTGQGWLNKNKNIWSTSIFLGVSYSYTSVLYAQYISATGVCHTYGCTDCYTGSPTK